MSQPSAFLHDFPPAAGTVPGTPVLDTRYPNLALVLFCLVLWLPGFFTLPPSDRDESRFAEATRQMIETGNYVEIRNGDTARNQKPIGVYWLQAPFALAARAAGLARLNTIWAYRMPSLLGGLLAVLGTFHLGKHLVGRRAALLAAAMLAASAVLVVETHIAKTDAALLAATVAVMGLLSRAYLAPERFGTLHAALLWLALGVAILIKGPVAPMVAGLCVAALVIADRRARRPGWLARLRPGWGVMLMLLVVLPWFVAIGIGTHGKFFADSLGGDLGNKLAGGDDAHGAPPGLHFLMLALTLFPSSFLVLPAVVTGWRARREPAMRFLIAWALPAWLVFEVIPTKLPHYTLPLFPALCLIAARGVLEPGRPPGRMVRIASVAMFVLGAVLVGGGAAVLPMVTRPGWQISAALGLPVLAATGLLTWLVLRAGDRLRQIRAALLTVPLVYWALLGLELPGLHGLWIAPGVVAALRGHVIPKGGFAAAGFAEPSLVFLYGADTRLLGGGRDGARFLALAPGRVVAVASRELPTFAREAAGLGIVPHPFAVVSGYNYSRGRPVELTLFDD